MRRDSVIRNLLGAGLDSTVAEKAADAKLTLTKLKQLGKKELKAYFADHEIDTIVKALKRQPIPDDVVTQLVEQCDWACCLCWDLDDRMPIILHHIEEHAKGGDDSYENLVVLCLNHHGLAHSKWGISQAPAPPELISSRKKEFEVAIAAFKDGKRSQPGREGDGNSPETQSDLQALKRLRDFMDRPAIFRHMDQEGNMDHFQSEMTNIMRALSIGNLATREGDDLGKVKPVLSFSNPQWRDRLTLLRNQIDNIRLRLEMAARDGELHISPGGTHYCFNSPGLPNELDDMKRAAAALLNTVLSEANIPAIRGPVPQ